MSFSSLPAEIQLDIFLRLPLNSIGFSRCVCKPFASLLSSPRFLNSHLNHHTVQNNKNPRLLFRGCSIESGGVGIYSIDYASISSTTTSKSVVPNESVVRVYYPFECDKNLTDRFEILGSCNGLIFLCFSSEITIFCLWNPLTGEYRRIPEPPSKRYDLGCGFGYDSHNNDYKLVRMEDFSKVQVYSLGSDSWKVIKYKRYPFACPHKESSGFFFNGALHWVSITPKSNQIIVSFDLSNEIFRKFALPEQPLDDEGCIGLGILKSCLCLVYSNPRRFDIWVMQDYNVKDSWTKQCSTVSERFTSYTFRRPIWSFENGEILIGTHTGFVLIDPSKDTLRNLGTRGCVGKVLVNQSPTDYVESLVSLGSHTYVIRGVNPMQVRSRVFQRSCRVAS